MTFSEAVRYGGDSIGRHEAGLILSNVTGASLTEIAVEPHCVLSEREESDFMLLLGERRKHVPLQYLLGEWQFMGLKFTVNPHVLIPRQDTELLAETALKICAGKRSSCESAASVLDLCTGSGCVGISLAKLADTRVTASDISAKALETAGLNAERNGVADRVRFIQSDLFDNIPDEKFDLIISNPPYIPSGEIPSLQAEVRDWEPHLALDGGADGLDFYRRIIPRARGYLAPGGTLLLEAGPAEGIRELLKRHGYENIKALKDLAGIERVIHSSHR